MPATYPVILLPQQCSRRFLAFRRANFIQNDRTWQADGRILAFTQYILALPRNKTRDINKEFQLRPIAFHLDQY